MKWYRAISRPLAQGQLSSGNRITLTGTFLGFGYRKSGGAFPSSRFFMAGPSYSGAAATAALGHFHAADRFMLPAVHALKEVCIALSVAVALAGFALHSNSSLFIFWHERAGRLGSFALSAAHQPVRRNHKHPSHVAQAGYFQETIIAIKRYRNDDGRVKCPK